jgi:hypothetical protein
MNVQLTTFLLHSDSADGTQAQLVQYKTVTCVAFVLCCIIKNMGQVTISLYVTVLFDHFTMLYQLLKMCSNTGLNHNVSVCCMVQSRCLFQWTAVNDTDCRALPLEPELI